MKSPRVRSTARTDGASRIKTGGTLIEGRQDLASFARRHVGKREAEMAQTESAFSNRVADELGTSGPPSGQSIEWADRSTESSLDERSDRELIAAIVSHNDSPFTELFRRHFRSVVGSSRMILASSTASPEVTVKARIRIGLGRLRLACLARDTARARRDPSIAPIHYDAQRP